MQNLTDNQALAIRNRWRADPELYLTEALGITNLWEGQRQILRALPAALASHRNIVVPSGHALGKDFLASCIALWFVHCYSPSKCIITAPTERQVKNVLWAEIETRWENRKIEFGGTLKNLHYDIRPDWFILGFTTSKSGELVGKAQGFHSPHVLVIASEAQAIPDAIYEQLDGVLTGSIATMLMIGNPLRTNGRFAEAISSQGDIVIELSCLNSPNVVENKEVIPGLVSRQWVEDKRSRWFEKDAHHPLWYSRVLGKKPIRSVNTVFSSDIVDAAIDRETREIRLLKSIGLDPARYGDDETVLSYIENGELVEQIILSKLSAPEVVTHGDLLARRKGDKVFVVDCDGLGGPYADYLRLKEYDVIEFHGSAGYPSDQHSSYQNKRAEAWFYVAEQMRLGKVSIPDDEFLKAELLEVMYFVNERGKIQLESKDDVKERLGRSPDRADAFILGVWGQRFTSEEDKNDYGQVHGKKKRWQEVERETSHMAA